VYIEEKKAIVSYKKFGLEAGTNYVLDD